MGENLDTLGNQHAKLTMSDQYTCLETEFCFCEQTSHLGLMGGPVVSCWCLQWRFPAAGLERSRCHAQESEYHEASWKHHKPYFPKQKKQKRGQKEWVTAPKGDAYLDVGRLSKVGRSPNLEEELHVLGRCLAGAQWFSRSKSPPFPEIAALEGGMGLGLVTSNGTLKIIFLSKV